MTWGPGPRIAAMAVIVGMLGGCGASIGDGDLVDDWPVMAEAKPEVPPAQVCYPSTLRNARSIDTWGVAPKPCTESHMVETFHVGEFPADVTTVPVLGDARYRTTYGECEAKAKEFLGADWYTGRLVLNLTVPLTRQWEGGARWFKCELVETELLSGSGVTARQGSLAGTLTGAAPVAQRCGNITGKRADGSWDDLTSIDCAQPHDVEFAGVFQLTGAEPPTADQLDTLYDDCWNVIARYLNGTRGRIQVGYLSWSVSDADWKRGDNWARCYAWAGENKKMVGSVKGIGNAAPRR